MPPTCLTILECGASHVALGRFRRLKAGLRVEAYAEERFPAHAVAEPNWPQLTAEALSALAAQTKLRGPAVLVLPPHLTLGKLIKVPRVAPAKRRRVMEFEAGQAVPYALSDVLWDTVPVGGQGPEDELLLVAAKREAVESLCAAASAAGFAPEAAVPSSVATLALVRAGDESAFARSLVLNIGARSTVLTLLDGARHATRTVPLGGSSVTQQVAEAQDWEVQEAERIKVSPDNGQLLGEVLAAFATKLAQEVTRTVLYFERQSGLARPTRVWLTGGAARLEGLVEALAQKLQLPVTLLEPKAPRLEAGAAGLDLSAVVAQTDLVGAAVRLTQSGAPTPRLLPAQWRNRAGWRRGLPWLGAAAALLAVALLLPSLHFRTLAQVARAKTAAIESEIAPLRAREARQREKLARLEELHRQVAFLQGVHDRRFGWLQFLADLQERLVKVEDVWLDSLHPVAPAAGAPLRLVVSGRMLDKANPLAKVSPDTMLRVRALLGGLADSPYVAAIESERFDTSQPGILRFDFVMVMAPVRPL